MKVFITAVVVVVEFPCGALVWWTGRHLGEMPWQVIPPVFFGVLGIAVACGEGGYRVLDLLWRRGSGRRDASGGVTDQV